MTGKTKTEVLSSFDCWPVSRISLQLCIKHYSWMLFGCCLFQNVCKCFQLLRMFVQPQCSIVCSSIKTTVVSYKRVCFRTSRGLNMWTKESAVDRVDKWPVFMMHQTCSQGTFKNIHYFSSSSALFFNLHVPVFFLFGMERSTILNVWILPVWKGMACLWQWRAISNAFPLIQMSVCL